MNTRGNSYEFIHNHEDYIHLKKHYGVNGIFDNGQEETLEQMCHYDHQEQPSIDQKARERLYFRALNKSIRNRKIKKKLIRKELVKKSKKGRALRNPSLDEVGQNPLRPDEYYASDL